jgi:hypothetical protein
VQIAQLSQSHGRLSTFEAPRHRRCKGSYSFPDQIPFYTKQESHMHEELRTYLTKCRVSPDHVILQAKSRQRNEGTNQLAAILGRLTSYTSSTRTRRYTSSATQYNIAMQVL